MTKLVTPGDAPETRRRFAAAAVAIALASSASRSALALGGLPRAVQKEVSPAPSTGVGLPAPWKTSPAAANAAGAVSETLHQAPAHAARKPRLRVSAQVRFPPSPGPGRALGQVFVDYFADLSGFFHAEKYLAPPMIAATAGGVLGSIFAGPTGTVVGAVAGSGVGGVVSLAMAACDLGLLPTVDLGRR